MLDAGRSQGGGAAGAALGGRREERPIRRLPALLVNQIAAGEVVERPASVVKELLDNAIDAGATRIIVELEGGGIELVRVTDDGRGMPASDLPLAVAPHATSKIADAGDLDRIATMGFRGEALASIASVSRMTVRSRRAADEGASEVSAEGEVIGGVRPAAGAVGTCVTVRNLFHNTPARRKFLRTAATEQGHCLSVIEQLAMSHPAIGIAAVCDGRGVLDLPAGQSPRERVLEVLGKELEGQLVEVSADRFDDSRGVALWGLIGLPEIARATAKAQHVFLNGRPIRDRTIQHAIREAYRGLIEPGRYPTAVLMLEMDPGAVDVNVHPQKLEVRFRDQSLVHTVVLGALKEALQGADLTPAVRGAWGGGGGGGGVGRWASGGGIVGAGTAEAVGAGSPSEVRAADRQAFASYFQRFVPVRPMERISFEAVRAAVAEGDAAAGGVSATSEEEARESVGGDSAGGDSTGLTATGLTASARGDEDRGQAGISPARPAERVLQVHNSYVVTEDEQGLVIVDQHALHERVMFEVLLARVAEGNLESQRMLVPAVVEAGPGGVERAAALGGLLSRLGIEVEAIGPRTLAVQAFPSFLFERGVEPGPFVQELLERAETEGLAPGSEAALHEVLDMMACKAAVKAGERLSEVELRELLRLREAVERSSNCPHGRPTSIRMTIRELDRRFGRV
jgi:DNA mismatch repair protein MutL